MKSTNTKKRSRTNYAAAAASVTLLASCHQLSEAFCTNSVSNPCSYGRGCRNQLFSKKGSTSKTRSKRSSSSSSSVAVEEVKPLTSVSKERRLNALDALSKKRTAEDDLSVSPLFADMDAAAMLLETFTQATNGSDDNNSGIAGKRMGSVPGAMTMSTLRQRAAEEGGYALSPRESSSLYSNSQSNQQSKRRAVASLIDKLDEKINEQRDFVEDTPEVSVRRSTTENKNTTPLPKKRGRGRPRKKALPQEDVVAAPVAEVTEVTPLEPQNDSFGSAKQSSQTTSSSARITGGTLINKRAGSNGSTKKRLVDSRRKVAAPLKGATSSEPLIGASAIVSKQRRRVVKSLPKSRRDETGNLIVNNKKSKGVYRQDDRVNTYPVGRGGNGANNQDSLFNRYYKTELLTAKEEYSLGMKVKFMVKCEAVHEGLSLELDRQPTIAEWAAACGFTDYDAEICSENYMENDLDRQIRPVNSETEEMDPNMFVGNGLVNDSGVGRGKGRVKKPPPTVLGKFHDDSYEKFKKIKDESSSDGSDYDEEEEEEEVDIFLYMQKAAPGQPINRGNPRIFREMILTAKEAKQRMVQCNMRLVMSIARRYHGVGVNVQDLVQEGSLGLARAAEKFDPKKGFKFSTYASWWIQQAVFRSIAYHSRTIRLPVHVHNLLNKVRRARQILQQELGRMPTNEEMADEMEMTIEKYNKMIRNTRHAISLEQPKYKNNPKDLGHESEASVGDMVDSSAVTFDENTPEQNVDHGLLHNDIQYMLGKLGEDERTVLCLRYGIHDGITRTVTLVASEMRQTKSWVRSQECRALRKLRRPWYEKRLKEHRQSLQASHSLPL